MSLSQEFRDFMTGYQIVTDVGNKKKGLELDEKRTDADITYKEALIDIQRQQLDMARQKMADANSRASAAAARAAEKAKGDKAEALLTETTSGGSSGGGTTSSSTTAAIPTGSSGPITFTPPDEEEKNNAYGGSGVGNYAAGGLVMPSDEDNLFVPPAITRNDRRQNAPSPAIDPAVSGRTAPSMPAPAGSGAPVASAIPTGPSPSVGKTPTALAPTQVAGDDLIEPSADKAPTPGGPSSPSRPTRDEAPTALSQLPMPQSEVIIHKSAEAAAAALDDQERFIVDSKSAVGGGPAPSANIITGEGGMSPQELEELRHKIDPDNLLPGYLKGSVALAEAYDYFMEKGEIDKARNIAGSIIAGERALSQTLGTLAVEAIKRGDMASASKLFGGAVDRFPSGHQIHLTPDENGVMTYTVQEFGRTVEQGKITGEQFMEMAGQLQNGELYMKAMTQFAAGAKTGKGGEQSGSYKEAIGGVGDSYEGYATLKSELDTLVADEGKDAEGVAELQAQVDKAGQEYARNYMAALDAGVKEYLQKNPKKTDAEAQKVIKQAIDDRWDIEFAPPKLQSVGDDGGDGSGGGAAVDDSGSIPPAADRVVGKTYTNSQGKKAIWRGNGWEEVNG